MVNRFEVLDRIDDLFLELDDEMIDDCLATGEPPDHGELDDPECQWCGHGWHGLPCDGGYCPCGCGAAVNYDCRCDTATARPDDTWRPHIEWHEEKALLLAHETGMDGWAAQALLRLEVEERKRTRTAQVIPAAPLTAEVVVARVREMLDQPARPVISPALGAITIPWGGTEAIGAAFRAMGEAAQRSAHAVNLAFDSMILHGRRGPHAPPMEMYGPTPEALDRLWGAINRLPRDGQPPREMRDTDPRGYALAMRQNRNTGPDRPAGQNAHRPRRH